MPDPHRRESFSLDAPVHTVDYHTAGEPFRIVDEPGPIPGATVADRRIRALNDRRLQSLRRLLCLEPRGHADMYGGFITEPDDDGAHFGVLFWHKDGFSTACGHGTIALGAWAVQTGRVPEDPSGTTDVVIDVPSGRATARVHSDRGRVTSVDFINVPSYVLHERIPVSTSRGVVAVDLAYGGAIYANVAVGDVGLAVEPIHYTRLIAIGREVKSTLSDTDYALHPADPRLSGVYGTVFYDDLGSAADGAVHQRNVVVFADGEVDRSPCGSGTCNRLALLAHQGRLRPGEILEHESIVGSRFRASYTAGPLIDGRPTVLPTVSGMAYPTGTAAFTLDSNDDLGTGFVLR